MFNPLSEQTIKQVVAIQWRQVQEQLKKNGINLVADGLVIEYLAQKGYNPQFGARPLKRFIQRDVLNKLSSALLADELGSSASIRVTLDEKREIKFTNDTKSNSKGSLRIAHIRNKITDYVP